MPPQDQPATDEPGATPFPDGITEGAPSPDPTVDQTIDQTSTEDVTDMSDANSPQEVAADIDSAGDVLQNHDFDSIDGEGAATAGAGSSVLTGDGSVQAGGDIDGSTIGDGNIGVSGTTMSESSLAGDVASNDMAVSAEGGSSLAFGEGSTSTIDDGDTSVGANYGNFAGEGDLTNEIDNSVNDSGNTTDSGNSEYSSTDNSTSESTWMSDSGNTDSSTTDASSSSEWSSTNETTDTTTDNSTFESNWTDTDTTTSDDDVDVSDNSTESWTETATTTSDNDTDWSDSSTESWSDTATTTSDNDVDWSDNSTESWTDNSVSDDDFEDFDAGGVPADDPADFGS